MNCWEVWHNVTLDVHTELLKNRNGTEHSASHLGAHMYYTQLQM